MFKPRTQAEGEHLMAIPGAVTILLQHWFAHPEQRLPEAVRAAARAMTEQGETGPDIALLVAANVDPNLTVVPLILADPVERRAAIREALEWLLTYWVEEEPALTLLSAATTAGNYYRAQGFHISDAALGVLRD